MTAGGVTIYPIPAKDFVTIDFANVPTSVEKITIFDALGRVVLCKNIVETAVKVQVPINLPMGLYLLQMQTECGVLEQKIVVE